MFDNIGGKIKTVAAVVAGLGIVAFVIGGIVLLVNGAVVAGILMAVIGALGSWVGSFALYGFGELIENSAGIISRLDELDMRLAPNDAKAENLREDNPDSQVPAYADGLVGSSGMWICGRCGQRQASYRKVCWQCGTEKPDK